MQVSVWEKESFYAPQDIIIIGSGFVGLWSAWHLKQKDPGLKITIVDRGIIPTGASTRNAGFACFGSVSELVDNVATDGEEAMLALLELRYKGILQIRDVFSKKTIGFDLCGGYELFTGNDQWTSAYIGEKIDYLNTLLRDITGKKRTFKMADGKIEDLGLHNIQHLVENKLEGQLHSGKLCQALMLAVQSMGVTILNTIEVKNIEKINDHLQLHTHPHLPLRAAQVLVCTNAFAQQLTSNIHITPARGQVLVTSPIENLPLKGTFHFDEGFYYFRNLGNRVLLGGARNKAFEEETTTSITITDTIQKELEQFLARYILPGYEYTITDRWSGIMGMGPEKMPVIKELEPNVFCAVGLGGMGVALAPVLGQKIATMMC